MKHILFAGLIAFTTVPVFAADTGAAPAPAKAKTAQQQRMTDCNAQAKGKTGDDRKTFMSSCLKGEAPAAAAGADKQAKCEADAKSKDGKALSGAAKNSFVKSCLKKAA